MIAVTFALRSESSEFLRRLRNATAAGKHAISGSAEGAEVCVLHTGVGAEVSRERIAVFLREVQPRRLISSGFAGALTDELSAGDLLLGENFSDHELVEATRQTTFASPLRVGRLQSATEVVHAGSARAALAISSGAVAVDMETATIAAACRAAGVAMLSLRVISDTPRAPFPAPPSVLFDLATQRTNYTSLVLHIMLHPAALPRLIGFGRRIAAARVALTDALSSVIAHRAFREPAR